MAFHYIYRLPRLLGRLLLALCLVAGVFWASTTFVGEYYYRCGTDGVRDGKGEEALRCMEGAETWAPEWYHLRIGATRVVRRPELGFNPLLASQVIGRELLRNPYSVDLLVAYMANRKQLTNSFYPHVSCNFCSRVVLFRQVV